MKAREYEGKSARDVTCAREAGLGAIERSSRQLRKQARRVGLPELSELNCMRGAA